MSESNKRKSNFIVQGSILAMAGIISRLIGIARRFPMEHIIGDVGNGYYASAYEVYSLMLLISCYSMPLAVSKIVSKNLSEKRYENAKRAFQVALAFSIVAGCITFFIVEVFGGFLAGTVVSEPMSEMALKVLGPALLIVSVMGVFRGYFQGLGTMMPTAISQIIEQIFVLIASLIGAYFMYDYGEKVGALLHNENYAPSYGAAGASLGPVVGSLIGFIFLLFIYFAYKSTNKPAKLKGGKAEKLDSYSSLLRIILLTILPVLLSTTVYNISNVLDISLYNHIMIDKGMDDVRAYNLGVYSGKYRVLVNVPIALANAMCSSVVPVLAGLMVKKNYGEIRARISQSMRFTMIIAIPCAVGLAVLARPVIDLLFSGEVDLAVELLHIGSISVIFYSMSTLTNGVLQGIDKLHVPVINALIALTVHIIFLVLALQAGMGVHALVYANIIFAVIVCVLNSIAIYKFMDYRQEMVRTFAIPLGASAVMGVAVGLFSHFLGGVLGHFLTVIIGIILGATIYFVLMVMLKGISENDLKKMPGGRSVLAIAKKVHLM